MPEVILTRGLPASGKSTWSKEQVLAHPGRYKRVSKDDLRAMLDAGRWSKANEATVLEARDLLILLALKDGKNVIVDDTNLAPHHEHHIRSITEKKAKFKIEDQFLSVPLEECIKRDLVRPNSVGEKVIRDMYRKYVAPAPNAPSYDETLPTVALVDLDGTLALMGDRSPYAADLAYLDRINEPVRLLIESYLERGRSERDEHFGTYWNKIILMSGRQSEHRAVTEKWLADHGIRYEALFMRPAGDSRKDSIVKRELFDTHIRGKYNVDFVLDDRNQVVDMWRNELGLTCLQVAEGDF